MYEELFTIEIKASRARQSRVYSEGQFKAFDTHAEAIKAIKAQIKACRQLGAKMSLDEAIKALKDNLLAEDAKRLAVNREQSRKLAQRRKELQPQVADLDAIDLGFEKVEDVSSIEISFKNQGGV